jgi:hypothetical protein
MENLESPKFETPLTTPNDIFLDDTFEPVGVSDGQTPPSSPTVGHSSTTVAVKVGQSDVPVESDTTLDLRNRMRTPEHVLGTQAVSELFGAAQFSRSQRSIERYCHSGKLDAYFDPNTKQYWITRGSVDQFIESLKKDQQISNSLSAARYVQTDRTDRQPPSMSATDGQGQATMSDTVGQSTSDEASSDRDGASFGAKTEIKKLNAIIEDKDSEIRDLKITNKVKDGFIGKMGEQFSGLLDRITNANKRVGELENENGRLRELPAAHSIDS